MEDANADPRADAPAGEAAEADGSEETDAVRAYYRALDGHDYDLLASLLAPEFVQERPDRTLDGHERFVRFMREERPLKETTHELSDVYPNGNGVAAVGRLLDADGEPLVSFVDVFSFDSAGKLTRLETYAK